MKTRIMMYMVLSLLILVGPLVGQTKIDNQPNYGYKLLPLVNEQLPAEHRYHPKAELAKSATVMSVDYSSLMPPVLNQGSQGSCMAFSRIYALSYLNNSKYGVSTSHQYSPSFIYNLSATSEVSGLGIYQAYCVLSECGCTTYDRFPYNDLDWTTQPSLVLLKDAIKNRIADWNWWKAGDTLAVPDGSKYAPIKGYWGINQAKTALAAGKTVVLDLTLTGGYGGAMAAENWIYSYAAFGTLPPTGGHSICVVGYNDTLLTKDGYGAFRVINSWGLVGSRGESIFDKGYCWITYKMLAETNYNADFSTFTIRDNYQPQLTATFDMSNFGHLYILFNISLKTGNNTQQISKPVWKYRQMINTTYLNQSVVDLTDLIPAGTDPRTLIGGEITVSGLFSTSLFTANPVIKKITVNNLLTGNEQVITPNLVIKDSVFSATWRFSLLTGVEENKQVPATFSLAQNYPNPFNPSTAISYSLPKSGNVTLKVYDLLGREVATLVNEFKAAGSYTTNFSAVNFASGMYVYVLRTENYTSSKKMVVMK